MNIDKLKKSPYFTNRNLKLYHNIKYPEVYITRLKKLNKIITIKKGKYTLQEDNLSYATQILFHSYISFLSALNFYNYSTQIPSKIRLVVKYFKKPLENIK